LLSRVVRNENPSRRRLFSVQKRAGGTIYIVVGESTRERFFFTETTSRPKKFFGKSRVVMYIASLFHARPDNSSNKFRKSDSWVVSDNNNNIILFFFHESKRRGGITDVQYCTTEDREKKGAPRSPQVLCRDDVRGNICSEIRDKGPRKLRSSSRSATCRERPRVYCAAQTHTFLYTNNLWLLFYYSDFNKYFSSMRERTSTRHTSHNGLGSYRRRKRHTVVLICSCPARLKYGTLRFGTRFVIYIESRGY